MQKLAEICIKRPVFATMLILMLVVLGLDAYRKLGVDLFPKVEFPIVTVTTTLRGASPEEVETQLSKRIEEAVNTVSGIDELQSMSAEGLSRVIITFVLDKDAEIAAQEVRDKVSTILGQLPNDAEPPVVEKLATDASPIINIVVSANRDLREITKLVDDRIKKDIETINGVGQIRFIGERERQIQIWLDGQKMYSYGLNIDQVRGSIAAQNIEVPGGRLDQGARELSVRTLGRILKPADFGELIVANSGAPIRVKDIGSVEDGYKETRSSARLDGKEAVVLQIRKQAGTNTLEIIDRIKERVEELRPGLPSDLQIAYVGDQSGFIKASFEAVQEHLILGGVLAGIVVLIFMRNWRSTLIAGIAIPTSIIATYTLLNLMGFTLNQITMLALTLMVGIVIDDAIVVLENIFRFMEEKNLPPVQAAIEGTRDIGLAVLATTLSLAVVFLPVAFMTGIVGRFMSSFGFTAAFAIMVSLLVSFTLTPMLCGRFLKLPENHNPHASKETWIFRVVDLPYQKLLMWSMRHRWVIVVLAIATVLTTGPIFKRVGIDFLPQDDQSEFEITIRMPAGSSLDGTDGVLRGIEADLKTLPGVKSLLTLIGSDSRQQVDRGSVLVTLVDTKDREATQFQIMDQAREMMRKYKDLVISVQLPSVIQGAGPNRDFQYILNGPDLEQLDKYAQTLVNRLQDTPGVVDIESSYEAGKPEVRVRINRDRASELGVNVASIATAIRTLVAGDEQVTTYREGDDRYDVGLRVTREFRQSPDAMSRLYVPSSKVGNVSLANVASLQESTGPINIDRRNRQRQIMISASVVGGQSLSEVLKITEETVKSMDLAPQYRTGTIGRTKELGRAMVGFVFAFLLSITFMYMILAAQFESFIDPVTILLSLPLSVPFAVLSLMVMKENFSVIYSSVGILVLFGIVKKNSILQLDHIKSLRREGLSRLDAIFHGCEDRLRPILMTTAALVAGMLPLALGTGAGAGTRRTVAIVVIGGQTLCLLLTLLVTPVAYSLFDDLGHYQLFSRIRRLLTGGKWAPAAMVLLALLAPAVQAQTVLDTARVGVTASRRPLTLKEATEIALRNNLEIEIERTNIDTQRQLLNASKGAFDPIFRYNPSYEKRNTPAASALQAATGKLTEDYVNNNFSLLGRTPWRGLSFNAGFDNARTNTNNPFVSLNPNVNSRLTIGATLPLLRNREIDFDRAQVKIRAKQIGVSELDLEMRAIDVISRVEQTYWDLAAARQAVEVATEGVKLSDEQLARTRRQIEAGTLAPVELPASQSELERRKDTYYANLDALNTIENGLKMLLSPARDSDIWKDEIIPTDKMPVAQAELEPLADSVRTAIGKRPELKQVAQRREVNEVQSRFNRDQLKPQVNVVGAFVSSGLAGAVVTGDNPFSASNGPLYDRLNRLSAGAGLPPLQPPSFGALPGFLIGGYGQALQSLFGARFPSVQVGVQFDLNLRNQTAQANLAQTQIADKRLNLEKTRVEQIIDMQVRNALQSLQASRQRITAAEAAVKAAQEKLDSELRLFQTGESTNFFVLTRQNEMLESRRRLVVAQLEYNKATARLEQAKGETLETYKISIR
ncbi:MAG: efflux RND transporter permease subunit [Bryobacterales bacterium]|nr:efflux RND transporter permease subunit [Bryobacterales bacterium]